ncbi:MAG: hypothetical protein QM784_17820 [Polyangiaceae bacterium]
MATRNVPESSVSSYRFVSRLISPSPIIGLMRRGNVHFGYSSNEALLPNYRQKYRAPDHKQLSNQARHIEVRP